MPVPLWHGKRPILGCRIGAFAYLTDCSRIPDESWPLLDGLDVLVLDALRERPHPTHFSLSEASRRAPNRRRAAPTLPICATICRTPRRARGFRRLRARSRRAGRGMFDGSMLRRSM